MADYVDDFWAAYYWVYPWGESRLRDVFLPDGNWVDKIHDYVVEDGDS